MPEIIKYNELWFDGSYFVCAMPAEHLGRHCDINNHEWLRKLQKGSPVQPIQNLSPCADKSSMNIHSTPGADMLSNTIGTKILDAFLEKGFQASLSPENVVLIHCTDITVYANEFGRVYVCNNGEVVKPFGYAIDVKPGAIVFYVMRLLKFAFPIY